MAGSHLQKIIAVFEKYEQQNFATKILEMDCEEFRRELLEMLTYIEDSCQQINSNLQALAVAVDNK